MFVKAQNVLKVVTKNTKKKSAYDFSPYHERKSTSCSDTSNDISTSFSNAMHVPHRVEKLLRVRGWHYRGNCVHCINKGIRINVQSSH